MSCFEIRWLQKLQVFKTNARFYLIGSNVAETEYKLIIIDRTEEYELNIIDDEVLYTAAEINDIIQRLNEGNSGSSKRKKATIESFTAYGLVGFVKFLQGYYAIFITKQSKVAEIGGHSIYKIEDTSMVYLPNQNNPEIHPDEARYLKTFQTVDLSSHFYFSHSYDLTHSLQYNLTCLHKCHQAVVEEVNDANSTEESFTRNAKSSATGPCERFVWNKYLADAVLSNRVKSEWLLPIIHGYISQSCVNVYGQPIYITLIGRRSSIYAGTRFMKRGCNIKGDVANEVETEQIVHCAAMSSMHHASFTSFIQHRGSVPLHWEQDISANVVPSKPPITITFDNPYAQATALHFRQMFKRFGSPLIVLNLVRKRRRERKLRESILGSNYKLAIEYLNQFLPSDKQIKYFAIDMAHHSRGRNPTVLDKLANIAEFSLLSTGFFQSKPDLFKDTLSLNSKWRDLGGHRAYGYRLQTGVMRTNCVDCLDRTNSAQFIVGKCALAYQLFSLGVLSEPVLHFETDVTRLYEEMFEAHGDIIALQYGGSQLVHTIQSYRRTVAPWASHSRDIVTTISRYYTNTFSDADKQAAINLFLGVFRPDLSQDNLWDLLTDHYLHNSDSDVLASFFVPHYTRWWDPDVFRSLPIPYELVSDEKISTSSRSNQEAKETSNKKKHTDWYDDLYNPSQLTLFDEVFSLNMSNTYSRYLSAGYSDRSPFAIRNESLPQEDSTKLLASPLTSQALLDYSSNNESESEDGEMNTSQVDQNSKLDLCDPPLWLRKPTLNEFSPQAYYGIDLEHCSASEDKEFFENYLSYTDLNDNALTSEDYVKLVHVEPPTVDQESLKLYKEVVNHTYEPDYLFYMKYLSNTSSF